MDQPLFTRSITIIRHSCSDLTNLAIDRKEVNIFLEINKLIITIVNKSDLKLINTDKLVISYIFVTGFEF